MALVLDRSLRLDVETHLMGLIHDGQLRPDDRISEVEIARSLGISRTPVREAMIRLAAAGLLRHVPRRGTFLARLGHDEARQVSDVREHLESYAASLAAARVDGDVLDALGRIVSEMADAAEREDWTTALRLNVDFHRAVVQASGNQVLYRLWNSVNPYVWLLTPLARPGRDPQMADIAARHRVLVEALASRMPERADAAFRHHVRAALRTAVAEAAGAAETTTSRATSTDTREGRV
jgi:DNA-binding GntR family transcriptional regulator